MKSGEALKKIRENLGMNRWHFANRLMGTGIVTSMSQIKAWEEGDSLKVSKAIALCKELGVDPKIFFED